MVGVLASLALSERAQADTALTIPAPPFALPFLPSPAADWTVRLGLDTTATPNFAGAKDLAFSPVPIFTVLPAGSSDRFRGPRDSSSVAIVDFGQFRAGPAGKLDTGRTASSDKALRGLGNVGTTLEIGGFAEYYPVDWFRTRLEVRDGIGAHGGIVGDLTADAILPVTRSLTFSLGPRFSFKDAAAMAPYFGINAAQSVSSGLPRYRVKGGSYSTGVGGQVGYQLTPQWEVHTYVEYERLFGSAAASPLVKLRGSPDQVTVGVGASYAFDVKVR